MYRKKVDERVITLIRNGVETDHRSCFVIVGDKSRDQIKSLHDILHIESNKKPNVLWCYKDKLELSSHKKKQAKQMRRIKDKRSDDPDKLDKFSLFLQTNEITYCRYKDSAKCLGNTYGMCILQDFEALTPNLLATTIETVKGGGFIILLIRSLSTLTSLYTMVMDVNKRFRRDSDTGRFNKRLLLSLASCTSCMVMDDELNLLPISSHMKSVKPVHVQKDSEGLSKAERNLKDFQEDLKDVLPGKAVGTFLEAILDKKVISSVALLADRGRGKSAALGLAVAGAVAAGYSNIFVTAPSPENLTTLFEFILKGLNTLEYKEHTNYDIVKSSNPELKNMTIRIDINNQQQTIQYIQPHEHEKLSQVELLVVDEAAAIPLPLVKSLLGPYLVFLSSTVNGYEGTGRSLSVQLLQELEEQSRASTKSSSRSFNKIELNEPIRYASGDPVESWLNKLFCLDIANSIHSISSFPLPDDCELYYVNRDKLFSYHEVSELFLQRMMALYIASDYKYSPNNLQLLADSPSHQLFVLAGPVKSRNKLPDILCVIHICLEGKISKASVMRSLRAGHQPSGDQIPWKFYEQFQDEDFLSLSGARIVRIASHPDADEMRNGYESKAIQRLARYFEGKYSPISEVDVEKNDQEAPPHLKVTEAAKKVSCLKENIKAESELPPLLVHLGDRKPEKLHYLGVSFGLTYDLFSFWKKHKFAPFYICEVPNAVTGEHTCMMLKSLKTDDIQVNDELGCFGYSRDFKSGFATLLCSPKFNSMQLKLALSILDPKLNYTESSSTTTISQYGLYDDIIKSPSTMKRLKAYLNNSGQRHDLISNLKLPLAYLYFQGKFPVTLTRNQAYVLLIMGLQNQDDSYAVRVTGRDKTTILGWFQQVIKLFYKHLDSVSTKQFTATLPPVKEMSLQPHSVSVDEDLDEAAKKVKDDCKVAKSDGLLNPNFLERYAIADKDVDFESALQNGRGKLPAGGVISVKSSKIVSDKKRRKDGGSSSKSSKKKRTH